MLAGPDVPSQFVIKNVWRPAVLRIGENDRYTVLQRMVWESGA